MRVYLAGSLERTREANVARVGARRRLHSYAIVRETPARLPWAEVFMSGGGKPAVDLFLDSGAFTAWAKGSEINLDDYADFVLANRDAFTVVANLDVIPGKPGQPASAAEVERAAERGWENYAYLQKKLRGSGVQLIHTYHRGEDLKWLRKLMDHAEYFALGGLAAPGLTSADRIKSLDRSMELLTDDEGRPLRRFHGFGLTSIALMQMYPWFSVDSTSWVKVGNFGGCYVPLGGKVHNVSFSDRSPKLSEDGAHFKTYAPAEQAAILAYVEGKGYAPEQLATDYVKRDELNVLFFLDLEKSWVDRPWSRRATQKSFF